LDIVPLIMRGFWFILTCQMAAWLQGLEVSSWLPYATFMHNNALWTTIFLAI
jgi:hypothetical protein